MLPWIVGWPIYAAAQLIDKRYPRRSLTLFRAVATRTAGATSRRLVRLNADAQLCEAIVCSRLGAQSQSEELNDGIISLHRASPDPHLRITVAWAMNNRAFDLGEADRHEEAIVIYRAASELLPPEPRFVHPLAQLLMNWAISLNALGRYEEEGQLHDRIERLPGVYDYRSTQPLVAWALIKRGTALTEDHQFDEGVEKFTMVLQTWGAPITSETSLSLHEALAASLRLRGQARLLQGKTSEGMADIDLAFSRYGHMHALDFEDQVAWGLLTKAHFYEKSGRVDDARRGYEFVAKRYRKSHEELVRYATEGRSASASPARCDTPAWRIEGQGAETTR
jgi:tetratricopeptide (TPR) repeat protein